MDAAVLHDAEGRLCWGVDDFDESWQLPYTNDVVRLATSAKIVADVDQLSISVKDSCDAILDGYVKSLRRGGEPFVLAEREQCDLHDALERGGYTGHELKRFLVRILFCLFAEDNGI